MEHIELMSTLCNIEHTLASWLKEEIDSGKEQFDCGTCGAVSDIIKDMAETKKEYYEALYYKTVIEAMENGNRPSYGDSESYGYNHRHLNNGQFASSGRGHMVGYTPYLDQMPYIDGYLNDPDFERRIKNHSMGYSAGTTIHGEAYDNYKRAKRNYHESKSMSDKEDMDKHHMAYMHNTLSNLKAMWADADPMLKKKMKEDFGDDVVQVLEKM